jgi:hypothetical protein
MNAIMHMPRIIGSDEQADATVFMTVHMRLSNINASVPLRGDDSISYLNAALVKLLLCLLFSLVAIDLCVSRPLSLSVSIYLSIYQSIYLSINLSLSLYLFCLWVLTIDEQIQPMVVFLNTNYVSIPMEAKLTIPMRLFNGAWTPYDAAMTGELPSCCPSLFAVGC